MSAANCSFSNKLDACPLCAGEASLFLQGERDYLRCSVCALTFVPSGQHASVEREKARYASHRNTPEDAGYRDFLERLLSPLSAELLPGSRGLDYGCGPGPAAAALMNGRGFPTANYDLYFFHEPELLENKYDFVICTEVLEHLRSPARDLDAMQKMLKPGGVLGVMTGVLEDDAAFKDWWYRRDFTHIAFYRPQTLEFIARRRGWELRRPSRDTALFRKSPREGV